MPRFSEVVLDHAARPRNVGELPNANQIGKADVNGRAPRITIALRVDNQVVTASSFRAFGCGVTIAACSMLSEIIIGRSIAHCLTITEASLVEALDGLPEDKRFCAALAIRALRDAIESGKC
jgi:nitrogen fixation NifU-like protein